MRTGNVIKDPNGSMWVVSDVNDYPKGEGVVQAISFDSENCSAVMRLDDHTREEMCGCCIDSPRGPDDDCEDCKGSGHVIRKIKGWSRSKVLAPNVKEFILKGVKRAWRL